MGRRNILKTSAAVLGGAFLGDEPLEAYPKNVNTNSKPSELKITDLRVAVAKAPMTARLSGSTPTRASTDWAKYATGQAPPTP